jgi:DNA-binding response OmpR family regulator
MNEQKHIILIDDEPAIHMSFEMILFGTSYRKTSIIDAEEAMRYQQNKDKYDKPDLFIIDLMLGKYSGIDVINTIRNDSSFDNIPIILYTAYNEKFLNEQEMVDELNVAYVLPKVISKKELLAKIDSLIGS